MRRAAKIDLTQPAIVEALTRIGVAVEFIGKPLDLLVHSKAFCPHCHGELPKGKTELMECKDPSREGWKDEFTKAQVEFIARWPGVIHVARSPEEAVRLVLGEAMK